jgi:hypothetical protein
MPYESPFLSPFRCILVIQKAFPRDGRFRRGACQSSEGKFAYLGQFMTPLVVELSQYGEADCSWHPSVVGREN